MPRPTSLSLEILETFVQVVHAGGDAASVARQLGINQPSMSKRLRHLQHSASPLAHPWLERHGKQWVLTAEGERVLPAVEEIVRRYRQLDKFVTRSLDRQVRLACGQRSVLGIVRTAVERFHRRRADIPVRVSTLRGRVRIERVASGLVDLALVSHEESEIHEIARQPLHVEPLLSDRLVVVCAKSSRWSSQLRALPAQGVKSRELLRFPLILPEPDAGVRHLFDRTILRTESDPAMQIALEVGGWGAILAYTRTGIGVGLLTEEVVRQEKDLVVRRLDPVEFSPLRIQLICRRSFGGQGALDLSDDARLFADMLRSNSAAGR